MGSAEYCGGHSVGDSGGVQGSLSGRQWKCAGVTQWETLEECGVTQWETLEECGVTQCETWNECGVAG